MDRQPDRNRLDDVRAHDEVLRTVVQRGVTAAASRFGQHFPDEAALDVQLRDSAARIEALLTRFDGAVEMRVLVPARAAPPQDDAVLEDDAMLEDDRPGPGRRYLEELRRASVPSRPGIASALEGLVLGEKVEALAGGRGTVFAHLVMQDRVQDYRSAVQAHPLVREEHARVVGPLPLYSFAEPGVEP